MLSKNLFVLTAMTAILASAAFSISASAQTVGEGVEVEVGEQVSLSAEGVQSYSDAGAGDIFDIRLTRNQSRFIIVGRRAGEGSVLLIMRDGSEIQHGIVVTDPNATEDPDANAVNVRENIRIDLYFVQLSDSYSHAIGIAFPSVIGADSNSAGGATFSIAGATGEEVATAFSLSTLSFLPRLDLAQSNGWARLYRQGTLITANNTEANFRAGGEINVLVQNTLGSTLTQVEFGTEVRVRPRYDSDTGRIELRVEAEVSDLTNGGTSGIPGRSITNINTLVNLELGQSIVLAGFVARSESRERVGLPGLSQIPILGVLFGTHSRRYEESEGLMFIVPSVVDAVPLRRRNRIEEAMRFYDDFSGGVDDVEMNEQPSVGSR